MNDRNQILELLEKLFENEEIVSAILSGPRSSKTVISKITVRPLLIKDKRGYQVTEYRGNQAFHQNLDWQRCVKWIQERLDQFKQIYFYTSIADYHLLCGKKGNLTLLKKQPTRKKIELIHNREKTYLISEGEPISFLIHLGVMNQQGRVYPAKQDKFRQINRFLEMIEDILPHFDLSHPLHVIDFGCGKAALTFALFYFLKVVKGYQVKMVGVDLKTEVIQFCQDLSVQLGYQKDLCFIKENIDQYQLNGGVDLVVSLHACDTATDAALEKGVRWKAKAILSVPCCQHELMPQIHQESLHPLLKHGILKERFSALATDAARAQLLDVLGYQTQILEFIDMEHTPKNLLIRAIKKQQLEVHRKNAWEAYLHFKKTLHITPSLERRFCDVFDKLAFNNIF